MFGRDAPTSLHFFNLPRGSVGDRARRSDEDCRYRYRQSPLPGKSSFEPLQGGGAYALDGSVREEVQDCGHKRPVMLKYTTVPGIRIDREPGIRQTAGHVG
jgi:hypothetical protein